MTLSSLAEEHFETLSLCTTNVYRHFTHSGSVLSVSFYLVYLYHTPVRWLASGATHCKVTGNVASAFSTIRLKRLEKGAN